MTTTHAPVHVIEHAPTQTKSRGTVSEVRERGHGPVVVTYDRDHRGTDRDRDHDRPRPVVITRAPAPVFVPVSWTPAWYGAGSYTAASYTYTPSMIELIAPTSIVNGSIGVDTAGRLDSATALRFQDVGGGATYVGQVTLYDAEGGYQTVDVNTLLTAQNPTVEIPISNGASIVNVAVTGHSDWNGSLAIQAR